MDERLLRAIEQMKNGEEEGFNEIYSQTYNKVYFWARQFMKREEDARDLVQIVFTEVYRSIGTLNDSESFYGWLYGITNRQSKKIYRKKTDVLLTEETAGMFDTLESNDISTIPELTMEQKATCEIIQGIIAELPEAQKLSVMMYYFEGMKVEQIADVMECSVGTIKSRLNYARKYIKDRVEEKEKKEGYRLHVVGVPMLWYSIKLLTERDMLAEQSAQAIYNGVCANVGLEATTIHIAGISVGVSETAEAGIVGTTTAATAGTGVAGATETGVITAGTGVAEAGAVGLAGTTAVITGGVAESAASVGTAATGVVAKFTALATPIKALIVATAVVVAGVGIVMAGNLLKEEPVVVEEEEKPLTLADDLSVYLGLHQVVEVDGRVDVTNVIYPYKVSDTEYRFREEDLSQYGTELYAAFTKEDLDVLPEGVGVTIAYGNLSVVNLNENTRNINDKKLDTWYIEELDTETFNFKLSTSHEFIIRLVDASTATIGFDAWNMDYDYSEFIKLYETDFKGYMDFNYKYDRPSLSPIKVSDEEYVFKADEVQKYFSDGTMVSVCLNMPDAIEFVSIVGGDIHNPGAMVDFMQIKRDDANQFYFPISTKEDIVIRVKEFDGYK